MTARGARATARTVLTACALVSASPGARAQSCAGPAGAEAKLASVAASERLAFLRRTLDEQRRYAVRWKWAWFGIGTGTLASSVAQAVGWAAGADATRGANVTDNVIVSGFSVVTPVAALLFALRVETDAPAVDALLRATSDGEMGRCLVLERVEAFKLGADEEAFNTSWLAHAVGVLGVGAMVAILAIEAAAASSPGDRTAHWENAIGNGAGGLILTEAQILTQPTGAASAYQRYLRGDLRRSGASARLFEVVPAGVGIAVRWSF